MRTFTTIVLCACLGVPTITDAEDPWADSVKSYSQTNAVSGFTTSSAALGAPIGFSPDVPVNTLDSIAQVVSLGTPGGHITFSFDTPVTNDAENPMGLDFIVYSNAFWVGNNSQRRFQEPGIIEISPDGTDWYLIPGSRNYDYTGGLLPVVNESSGSDNSSDSQILAGTILNPNSTDQDSENNDIEYNWGYADLSPTLPEYLDNYVRPDDPFEVGISSRSGGGDAIDIAWAIDQNGNPANLASITQVRISPFINRTLTVGFASPEIMAIADVAPNIDTDNDGLLDEYETRIVGTDPTRSENTVLPLEIPDLEGGSPAGTLLGTAVHQSGHSISLYSVGDRTSEIKSTIVDLTSPPVVDGPITGASTSLSTASLQVHSTVTDFTSEDVDVAEVTIHYRPTEIQGLDESALEVYRFNSESYVQTGISGLVRDPDNNLISFNSRFSGTFVLASVEGSGESSLAEAWVDFNHAGPQLGTELNPFVFLSDASTTVETDGPVHLAQGSSTETLTIERAMTLFSTGGTVTIGALDSEAESLLSTPVDEFKSGFKTRGTIDHSGAKYND